MEKAYRNITYVFIGVAIIIFIGFFKTYFGLFPFFETVIPFNHFHAAVMISWLTLLIVQPILIRKRNYALHRTLGKFSYFLVPLMIFSMLVAYRIQYYEMEDPHNKFAAPHAAALASLFAPLTDVLPFTIFYVLAIKNKKKIQRHMRYIICTALVVVGAGFTRILLLDLGTSGDWAFNGSTLIQIFLFIAFIAYDKSKGKKIAGNAFTTAFIIFLIPNVLSYIIPQTQWWQGFAQAVAERF